MVSNATRWDTFEGMIGEDKLPESGGRSFFPNNLARNGCWLAVAVLFRFPLWTGQFCSRSDLILFSAVSTERLFWQRHKKAPSYLPAAILGCACSAG